MADIPSAWQPLVMNAPDRGDDRGNGSLIITSPWFRFLEDLAQGVTSGTASWNSTTETLDYDTGSITLSDTVGWAPYAFPAGAGPSASAATSITLAINGGSVAVPVIVQAHMYIESVSIRNIDIGGTHDLEFRVYRDAMNDSNTLSEVTGCDGTDTFLSAGNSTRTVTVGTPGTYLPPGIYWLVLRNTSATTTWLVGVPTVGAGVLGINACQTKTLGSALSSTLDFVAATWVKVTSVPICSFNGRAFGQTSAF